MSENVVKLENNFNQAIERKIAVLFVTDVVGFSKSMETNEDETLKSFRACKDILDKLFDEHGGRIFNTAGDSVLAEFQSAVSAVVCANEFQKLIKERNDSVVDDAKMSFRIGLNMGDVIVEGENLYGDGVNVAARLEALSQPGGVCLSKSIMDFVNRKTYSCALPHLSRTDSGIGFGFAHTISFLTHQPSSCKAIANRCGSIIKSLGLIIECFPS